MKNTNILMKLDQLIPDPKCSLSYTKDYELLIAVMLSAQSTDKRVNEVTKELFKYNLKELNNIDILTLENIIKPVGTQKRKALYIKKIASLLIYNYNGIVPNDRAFIESLPGVGHKTCNIVLSELYDVPAIAVDTHVARVSKRLGIANNSDNVIDIENKLEKKFPKNKWSRLHLQLVLFGRSICTSRNPNCSICPFKNIECKKPLN